MLLVLVLVLEQSSSVIRLARMRMMKVRWMLSEERLMELGHRISAAMVRFSWVENLLMSDHELLAVIALLQFAHDVHHFLRHLPELHLLGLPVHP